MENDFRRTGFRFVNDSTIEFYCDAENYELKDNEDVYITASFNGWVNTADSSWKMEKKLSDKRLCFVLKKKISDVIVPGNTGYPEFRFYAISSVSSHILFEKEPCDAFTFHGNKLILQNQSEIDEIVTVKSTFVFEKKLSDFDMNCPACRSEISNFRIVPGTKCLYRGYNPFKRSKNEMDTENTRISLVQKAFEIYGIKSDIALSGCEGANVFFNEVIPDFIKTIEKEGNWLCLDIDYNLVYFHSDAFDFSVAFKKVVKFILAHPSPFYIHCRLGSDRTGVISAIIAAICGASWDEISSDYEKTSNTGIAEYRNAKLLRYSLKKMLGKDPLSCENLSCEFKDFFIREGIFSAEEIDGLVEKLHEEGKSDGADFFDFSGHHVCASGGKQKRLSF